MKLSLLYSCGLVEMRIWIPLQSLHLLPLQKDFNYAVKKPTYISGQSSAGKREAFSRLLPTRKLRRPGGADQWWLFVSKYIEILPVSWRGNQQKCNTLHCVQPRIETSEKRKKKKRGKKKKGGKKKACLTGILYFGKTERNSSAEKPGSAFRWNP